MERSYIHRTGKLHFTLKTHSHSNLEMILEYPLTYAVMSGVHDHIRVSIGCPSVYWNFSRFVVVYAVVYVAV